MRVSLLLFAALVACVCASNLDNYNENGVLQLSFDHVIAGSGAAGATAAYQIATMSPHDSILILESGPLELGKNTSELGYNRILLSMLYDLLGHAGKSRPVAGMAGRTQDYPQTFNMVGGSTEGNNGNLVWLSHAMQQELHQVTQSDVLSPENYMEASKALETFVSMDGLPVASQRGTSGRLVNTRVPLGGPLPLAHKLYGSLRKVHNITILDDYQLNPYGFAVSWNLFAFANGLRSSSRTAFLGPDLMTQNPIMEGLGGRKITVITNASVFRILIDERNGKSGKEHRAVGFSAMVAGTPCIVRGRKSVIDATGFMSAHLLQVSGIGRKSVLEAAGIKHLVEANVGFNYTNHLAASFSLTKPVTDIATDPANANFTCTMGAFLPDPRYPANGKRGVQMLFQDGLFAGGITPNPAVLAVTAFLLAPESKGSITVKTPSLGHAPVVDYNYMASGSSDMQFWILLANKTLVPFFRHLEEDHGYVLTNPSYAVLSDPAQATTWFANNVRQTHHGRGTVLAAPRSAGGVVDPDTGKVYGVEKLYCYGTSTLPIQPDGNNAQPVFAITYLQVREAIRRSWRS